MNTESVDSYLADGCGRCEKYRTAQCKVHRWPEPLMALRGILRDSELAEGLKWGAPCYTLNGRNVVMLGALNDNCVLSFFKGVLLPDPQNLLERPGPNTQAARQLRFTSLQRVIELRGDIERFVAAAIDVERSGMKVSLEPNPEPVPSELRSLLEDDPALAAAFHGLTPGRRRSHVLHVAAAKQTATRARRAAKCVSKILLGQGFHDR